MSYFYYNKDLSYTTIKINNKERKYIMTGTIYKHQKYVKLLFCFPGGDETAIQFIQYTNLYKCGVLCVVFEGQSSKNGQTFINAYPWFGNAPLNDVEFVEKVFEKIPKTLKFEYKNNIEYKTVDIFKHYLFLTGKSDGCGFSIYLTKENERRKKLPIKSLFLVSSALFCLDNTKHYGNEINKNLLSFSIPTILLHGTSDTTMPYNGQNFTNQIAASNNIDYWKSIDNNIERKCINEKCSNPTNIITNTYTADIPAFVNNWNKDYKYQLKIINYSIKSLLYYKNKHYFLFIPIVHGTHVWFGHQNSGPNANNEANLVLDATDLLCKILDIPLASYQPSVKTNIDTIPILSPQLLL